MTVRVALYARVSTLDQHPDNQLAELHRYCTARGWESPLEYIDVGVSGSKDRRPALDELMRDAKRRRFDCVAVLRLDRFARSTRHLLNSLADFDALGIAFVSLSDSWDTSTPSGK